MPLVCDRRSRGGEELAIQSTSLEMTTFSSSDAHLKKRSQFISSIASAPSAPAALESLDVTYVMSSSVNLRGTVYRNDRLMDEVLTISRIL